MRLQLITHSYLPERTPPQRRWQHFVAALREAGWEVDVVVPEADPGHTPHSAAAPHGSDGPGHGPAGERLIRTRRVAALAGSRDGRFLGHVVHALAAVPASWAAPRPDVLVITVPALPTTVTGLVVSRLRRVPLIVEMRDAWPDLARESGVRAGALGQLMELVLTTTQRSADLVVTVTEGFARALRSRGVHPVTVVGNGVDLDGIPAVAPRDRPAGTLHVLYLGNHGESQGLETVLQAAAQVATGPERIHVRLVGSGTRREALVKLNESLGSPAELLEPVHGEELTAQYAWADTCVVALRSDWPSFAWTIPSKTYELLAVGRHITGMVTGEAAEVLRRSGAADIVPADSDELAALWRHLARDPQSTRTGARGRDWVREHADLPRLGRRFVQLATGVVSSGSVPGAGPRGVVGRVRQLAANVALTGTTVLDHVHDDPAVLALQVSRRLPAGMRRRAAAMGLLWDRGRGGVLGALGLAVSGRDEQLRAHVMAAADRGAPASRLVQYADVVLSTGDARTAQWLLDRVPAGTTGTAAVRARLIWHRGRMSEAVQSLGTTGREGRLRRRLASERTSFRGSRPHLDRALGYRPVPDRVLHVLTNSLPHTGSGYAQRSHSILQSLQREGWDVAAVTRLGWPVQTGILHAAAVDTVEGVDYHRLLPTRLADGFDARLQQQAELLLDLVLQIRPALLHTTSHWVNAAVVRAVAEAVGIPWIYEVRGQLGDTWASTRGPEARESERYRLFSEREAEAARSADAVVTLGEQMRRRLLQAGVDPGAIVLCPNAVGGVFLEEPGSRSEARHVLGLDPEDEYVGTVSSLVPYEGLDTLVRAVAELTPMRPRLRLLLVGDGTALPQLLDLAGRLGIAERVVAPGRVDRSQSATWHRALDVFVVPRRDTSVTRTVTPMKTVEASASARPVVASDLPALAELVQDGVTGRLVPAEDPRALADALRELLDDPDREALMGRAAREWALAERTWDANARRYAELYQSLLTDDR